MSPLIDTPATRREAIASLLAMLALVLGAGESEASDFLPDSGRTSEPPEQPSPASTTVWESLLMLQSADDTLPLRSAYLDATFRWNGERIQLMLSEMMSRTGNGLDFHGTGRHVAQFELVGDGAAFLDAMSSEADASWERSERSWVTNPRVHCPVCECQWPERDSCRHCGRTGWVVLSLEDAQRSFDVGLRKRQEQIDAAVTAAGEQ